MKSLQSVSLWFNTLDHYNVFPIAADIYPVAKPLQAWQPSRFGVFEKILIRKTILSANFVRGSNSGSQAIGLSKIQLIGQSERLKFEGVTDYFHTCFDYTGVVLSSRPVYNQQDQNLSIGPNDWISVIGSTDFNVTDAFVLGHFTIWYEILYPTV